MIPFSLDSNIEGPVLGNRVCKICSVNFVAACSRLNIVSLTKKQTKGRIRQVMVGVIVPKLYKFPQQLPTTSRQDAARLAIPTII